MICWQPDPSEPAPDATPSPWMESPHVVVPLECLTWDDTAALKIPPPGATLSARLPLRPDELLSALIDRESLRRPLIRELTTLARVLGADEFVLLAIARRVCHNYPRS